MELDFQRLDEIQQMLSACDVIKVYMDPPPLSALLGASETGDARLAAALTVGIAYLRLDLSRLEKRSFKFHRHEVDDGEAMQVSLAEAVVLRMCARLHQEEPTDEEELSAQLLRDLAEIQTTVLASLSQLWIACTVFNAALHFCSLEYIDALTEGLQLGDDSSDPSAVSTILKTLGLTFSHCELVLCNRAYDCFDLSACCAHPGAHSLLLNSTV